MYLIDRTLKVEENTSKVCSYLIENDKIRYVNHAFPKWKRIRMNMSGFVMMNGRVMLSPRILQSQNEEEFDKEQRKLIKKGCTTVTVAPDVRYEKQLDDTYFRTLEKMKNCTLDYLIGLSISSGLLRPSILRRCRQLNIPFLFITAHTEDEIKNLPWTHLSQTLTAYPTVFIPKINKSLLEIWYDYCFYFNIHTSLPMSSYEPWGKSLLQKVGLYPEKGVMLSGSDVDYLLYLQDRQAMELSVYEDKEPSVVVLKGEILKSAQSIYLKHTFGSNIHVKLPGRFLTIEDQLPALKY